MKGYIYNKCSNIQQPTVARRADGGGRWMARASRINTQPAEDSLAR